MKKAISTLLIYSTSFVISLGFVRLSMGVGDPYRLVPEEAPSSSFGEGDEEVAIDAGTPDYFTRQLDPLRESCSNGYSWACRVLDEQYEAGFQTEEENLQMWCARGGACFCVKLAQLRDGEHAHWSAARAFARGCSAGSGFACAHAGARIASADPELGRQMLVRACDLQPAADGCRLLGHYLVNQGEAGAKVAFERGCLSGDGRACLALAGMEPARADALRERASELLFQTCFRQSSEVAPRCGGTSESVRFAACGELADLRIDGGHALDAHTLVRHIAQECDEREERRCDLAEFLPMRLLERPHWDRWCDDGSDLACRVADSRTRAERKIATR